MHPGSVASRRTTFTAAFFARSDHKFSSREVLLSGAVASDRSGNECAVKQLKLSNFIARGIHQTQDLDQFTDVWIAWGFQCNFMFEPVLFRIFLLMQYK